MKLLVSIILLRIEVGRQLEAVKLSVMFNNPPTKKTQTGRDQRNRMHPLLVAPKFKASKAHNHRRANM